MRVVYVTLEFTDAFSGNGTASQSFVRALLQLGDSVCIICCRPEDDAACASGAAEAVPLSPADVGWAADAEWAGRLSGVRLPVPASQWRTHGVGAPYEAFAQGAGGAAAQRCAAEFAAAGGVDVIVGVDWEGRRAVSALRPALPSGVSYVYYNYRVFFANSSNTPEETAFYMEEERAAAAEAACYICLCRADRDRLAAACGQEPHVLLPALRSEMHRKAEGAAATAEGRKYLLCCVRVVPEKNVGVFCSAVELLGADWLRERGVVPFMVGAAAASDGGFAEGVRAALRAACPAARIEEFLPADQLAAAMSESLLNVHPALTEAFGMTITEAAAMGCPSLTHHSHIGAADLLHPGVELDTCDMTSPEELARELRTLLDDEPRRMRLAEAARRKAMSYDELENGRRLRALLADPGATPQSPSATA